MYEIGFTSVTFRNKSRKDVCEIAKNNGIGIIEWGGDVHLPANDENALNEIISLQNEYGISAVSYGSYYCLGTEDYNLWKSIVNTAVSVDAKIIRIWQGSNPSKETSQEVFERMAEETRSLADIANEYGITLAFEFHQNTYNDSGEAALKFLKTVNRKNVKTYWQSFSSKDDAKNIKAVLPYLIAVHTFSWSKSGRRFALKRKRKEWKEFISEINNTGAKPYFILEFVKKDSEKQFKKDVKTLKRWLTELT